MSEIFYHNQKQSMSVYAAMPPATAPIRQRRSRTMFSDADIAHLEAAFAVDPYPDINSREEMAEKIGVAEARIQTWFQNKRSRTRRKVNNNRLGVSHFSPSASTTSSDTISPSTSTATTTTQRQCDSPIHCNQENVHPFSPREIPRRRSPYISPGKARASPVQVTTPGSTPARSASMAILRHNDSGVLDLSNRSTEEDIVSTPPRHNSSMPSPRQRSPVNPDAGRPFFTPWATPTPVIRPPTTTAATPLMMASGHNFSLAPQFSFPHPWMFGFTPSFNPQDKSYFLQPLPTSPFLQYRNDDILASPTYSPMLGGLASPYSSSRIKHEAFMYPDVQGSSSTETMSPMSQQAQATEGHVSSSSSSSAASQGTLSESPGSDTGSRSSGYSSRENDSPINVCD